MQLSNTATAILVGHHIMLCPKPIGLRTSARYKLVFGCISWNITTLPGPTDPGPSLPGPSVPGPTFPGPSLPGPPKPCYLPFSSWTDTSWTNRSWTDTLWTASSLTISSWFFQYWLHSANFSGPESVGPGTNSPVTDGPGSVMQCRRICVRWKSPKDNLTHRNHHHILSTENSPYNKTPSSFLHNESLVYSQLLWYLVRLRFWLLLIRCNKKYYSAFSKSAGKCKICRLNLNILMFSWHLFDFI